MAKPICLDLAAVDPMVLDHRAKRVEKTLVAQDHVYGPEEHHLSEMAPAGQTGEEASP